jgi:hypothetical protein
VYDTWVKNYLSQKLSLLSMVVLAVGILAVTGCSADNSSDTTSGSSTSPEAPGISAKSVEFDVALSSESSEIYEVGEADSQVFGVNIFNGSTTINDKSVQVRMLGTVNYVGGNGPFGSFLVLTWSDGTVIGLEQDGQATFDADSQTSDFTAQLKVINGSGAANGITGSGAWTGTRSGPLTTPIDIQVKLDLIDAPVMITG